MAPDVLTTVVVDHARFHDEIEMGHDFARGEIAVIGNDVHHLMFESASLCAVRWTVHN